VLWVFRLPGGSVRGTPEILTPGGTVEAPAAAAGQAANATAPANATSAAGSSAELLALQTPYYLRPQAEHGERIYGELCASCHGRNLDDGQFGPPLKGTSFESTWAGRSLGALGSFVRQRMPPGSEGRMTLEEYTDILAYLIGVNGVPAGHDELPADSNAWNAIAMPQ
jgi:polar amino acid transport system substrate-binding protein